MSFFKTYFLHFICNIFAFCAQHYNSFYDVVSSQIVYEDAKYKDKSPMFSHKVLVSTLNLSIFIEMKKIYVGIEIQLLNGNKVYVYISKSPVIQHNFQFKQDLKVAKCLNEKLKEFYK